MGPVHVVGASMGGAIAQELALTRPDLVRSVPISLLVADRSLAGRAHLALEIALVRHGSARLGPTLLGLGLHLSLVQDPTKMTAFRRDAEAYPYP